MQEPTPPREARTPAEQQLQADIRGLGEEFEGEIGIAVRDNQSGWTAHFNGLNYFPQQSVSKLWVAMAALKKADRGELDLGEEVTVRREDLTLFHQPIRELALRADGYRTTLEGLLFRAITQSDNTANDFLMQRVGGPETVRDFLDAGEITGVRFGPGERAMQSLIAGLEWNPEYSIERGFYDAREQLPMEVRRSAFESYLGDPVDGATPVGLVRGLSKLQSGELLSPESTERLLGILEQTRSGPRRLKGGLPPGWSIGHKTGTGQELQGEQGGYNDVGILTSPSGRTYSVAVLMGRTGLPLPERMELMQEVVRATAEYDRKRTESAPEQ